MRSDDRAYFAPWQVALRQAPGASLCVDDDCDLSGGAAHVGDCTPCTCGLEHAAAECPREIAHAAIREVVAGLGGKVHALDDGTSLAAHLDPVQRLAIVEAIERRAGLAPAELGDAYLVRTVGELTAAVAAYLGRPS